MSQAALVKGSALVALFDGLFEFVCQDGSCAKCSSRTRRKMKTS